MADDEKTYLDVLDFCIRMVDDARMAINANLAHGERPAAVLLDLLCRLDMVREYGQNNIPDRWKVTIE